MLSKGKTWCKPRLQDWGTNSATCRHRMRTWWLTSKGIKRGPFLLWSSLMKRRKLSLRRRSARSSLCFKNDVRRRNDRLSIFACLFKKKPVRLRQLRESSHNWSSAWNSKSLSYSKPSKRVWPRILTCVAIANSPNSTANWIPVTSRWYPSWIICKANSTQLNRAKKSWPLLSNSLLLCRRIVRISRCRTKRCGKSFKRSSRKCGNFSIRRRKPKWRVSKPSQLLSKTHRLAPVVVLRPRRRRTSLTQSSCSRARIWSCRERLVEVVSRPCHSSKYSEVWCSHWDAPSRS